MRSRVGKKPSNLVSSIRGLMPSKIEITPSRVISDKLFFADSDSQFPGGGRQEEVSGPDAVNSGDKCDCDAASDLVDLVEMLHDLDQSYDCANDSYRRGEAARRFEDLRDFFFQLRVVVESKLHDLPKLARLGSIHCHHQRSLQKGVRDIRERFVEGDDSVAPGTVSVSNQFLNVASGSRFGSTKTCRNCLKARRTTGSGNWTSKAPNVPPKTMIAAVG